ncbi:MAG: hypothetical protein QOD00_3182 [Blastocatellia bacterium]|jgi:CHAD domain-containing protein|nr:hypothetical protein [Blastocatellia bacterium]
MAKAANIEGLDCDANALDGVRLVLHTRLEEMCAFREAAFNADDVKGVHDMRVAARRLRSALRDFAPSLRRDVPPKRLKAIADALGAVRDEDVAIAELEKLGEGAQEKETVAAGLEQLASERRERRGRARSELETKISVDGIAKFQDKFMARLERATKIQKDKKAAGNDSSSEALTFRQLGREIILARFSELQKLSGSLYRPYETEPLHRMRIAAKRLRYAMQIFAPCWGEQLNSFSQEVAGLQESLGGLHDCDVWIADLAERLERHRVDDEHIKDETADTDAGERSAAVWLLDHFTKERTKHFLNALARWHEWETTGFSVRLATTLEKTPSKSKAKPSPLPTSGRKSQKKNQNI